MKRFLYLTITVALLAGCATTPQPSASAQAPVTLYRGEVWTWDERTNVVTLRNGPVNTRVKITPDQIRLLRLHEIATVRGELAPPEEIAHTTVAPQPMRAVPQGDAMTAEVTGTVSAVDPRGLVSLDTAQGRITVWTATADTSQFPVGTPVTVQMSVQPVRMVPVAEAGSTPATTADPAAMVITKEGHHAVVIGPVTAVDPRGAITVESPRGPIVVAGTNLTPGAPVQVRTVLQKAK